jgi:hypothetical protein
MPLLQTLQDQDLGHLRVIAELWGLDPPQGSALTAASNMAGAMTEPRALHETVDALADAASEALHFILARGGMVPLRTLVNRFGPIRRMGPGRRDRMKPWRDPASPLEPLWYRGLIALGFADTPTGLQEFAFIPTDVLPLLPEIPTARDAPPGRPASPPQAWHRGATAADDLTTLFSSLRRAPAKDLHLSSGRRIRVQRFMFAPASLDLLLTLALEQGYLMADPIQPDPECIPDLLDLPRQLANMQLLKAWNRSVRWNDLAALQSITAGPEGWPNDPLTSRREALRLIEAIPPGTWWDLDQFVVGVHEHYPGFQRPGGDFSSWYLRDARSGQFLQGIEHWEEVEGTLLRHLITGPMHWLGAVDWAPPKDERTGVKFRLTGAAGVLFGREVDLQASNKAEPTRVLPDGRLRVPNSAPLDQRYQIARFSAWEELDGEDYIYRLTPASLQLARDSGLRLEHILSVLDRAARHPIPAHLRRALERWDRDQAHAAIIQCMILRVRDPKVLSSLLENPRTARYLGERLGPSAAVVSARDIQPLLASAVKLGLLIDPPHTE